MTAVTAVKRWFRSLRAYSFTASMMPVALAAAIAVSQDRPLLWWTFLPYAAAALLFHAGANVLNDYFDFRHGVDREEDAGPTNILTRGEVSLRFMLLSGHLYFIVGVAVGSIIGTVRGWEYVALGIACALGGYFYTNARFSFKYVALGDVAVFLLMGPALVAMGVWALSGSVPADVVPVTLPMALLVTAILHGNNLRDREGDKRAGVRTLANTMSAPTARWFFAALLLLPYLVVLVLVNDARLHPLVLLSFVSAPVAMRLARRVFDHGANLDRLPVACAGLHLGFSVVYVAALVAAAVRFG
ncbi:MAG: prenyltransferase [Spirochaetaceae bacterium]|nr:MAG: prenyltransferase [Spirochaetaceae bacterium]